LTLVYTNMCTFSQTYQCKEETSKIFNLYTFTIIFLTFSAFMNILFNTLISDVFWSDASKWGMGYPFSSFQHKYQVILQTRMSPYDMGYTVLASLSMITLWLFYWWLWNVFYQTAFSTRPLYDFFCRYLWTYAFFVSSLVLNSWHQHMHFHVYMYLLMLTLICSCFMTCIFTRIKLSIYNLNTLFANWPCLKLVPLSIFNHCKTLIFWSGLFWFQLFKENRQIKITVCPSNVQGDINLAML
jgi:hypothetical protein